MTDLGREVVVRTGDAGRRRLARTTAVLTGALAALVAAELATAASVELYAWALVGTVVVSTVGAALGMWSSASYGARLATGGLTGLILAGQVLVSSLGGPGGPVPRWSPDAVVVVAVAVVVLLLVVLAPRPIEDGRHPYAF